MSQAAPILRKIYFSFEFDVHSSDVHHYKLQLMVKDAINYGVFTRPPIIGMVRCTLILLHHSALHVEYWFADKRGSQVDS